MQNTSGISPVGHRVLVLPEEVEQTTESGIVISFGSQSDREALAQMYGQVIALGDTVWADQPGEPWCSVGDRVSFAKYSGLMYEGKDGKTYRVVNDLDIVAIVDEEVK